MPAIVGIFSMSYAVSTLTDIKWIYLSAGFIWFLVVLSIDRYIVSTLYKFDDNNRFTYSIGVLIRYIFAIFVGIVVAHPLVLLTFQDTITNEISIRKNQKKQEEIRRATDEISKLTEEIRKTENRAQCLSDLINAEENGTVVQLGCGKSSGRVKDLRDEKKSKINLRNCLDRLITAEQNGYSLNLTCGTSSGKPKCGKQCRDLKKLRDQIQEEITGMETPTCGETCKNLRDQREKLIKEAKALRQTASPLIKQYEEATDNKIKAIEGNEIEDYLLRVNTLSEIEKENPHVWTVKIFLILFFVLLDCLPISMKLVTPKGEYDLYREVEMKQAEMLSEMKKREYTNRHKFKGIADTMNGFVEDQESARIRFFKQTQNVWESLRTLEDEKEKEMVINYLITIRRLFFETLKHAQEKFMAEIMR